ncbi:hypothetical protein HNY73_006528 [Argiope bruennichi]|uniref:Uncharacterized protein n=1 Tax=Argiope bruennichi TaxID=94029 RepID=A0A8T0FI27_ARGBR|nr:hypothetical protein HNY73_006528 [Argiope bruennichi]
MRKKRPLKTYVLALNHRAVTSVFEVPNTMKVEIQHFNPEVLLSFLIKRTCLSILCIPGVVHHYLNQMIQNGYEFEHFKHLKLLFFEESEAVDNSKMAWKSCFRCVYVWLFVPPSVCLCVCGSSFPHRCVCVCVALRSLFGVFVCVALRSPFGASLCVALRSPFFGVRSLWCGGSSFPARCCVCGSSFPVSECVCGSSFPLRSVCVWLFVPRLGVCVCGSSFPVSECVCVALRSPSRSVCVVWLFVPRLGVCVWLFVPRLGVWCVLGLRSPSRSVCGSSFPVSECVCVALRSPSRSVCVVALRSPSRVCVCGSSFPVSECVCVWLFVPRLGVCVCGSSFPSRSVCVWLFVPRLGVCCGSSFPSRSVVCGSSFPVSECGVCGSSLPVSECVCVALRCPSRSVCVCGSSLPVRSVCVWLFVPSELCVWLRSPSRSVWVALRSSIGVCVWLYVPSPGDGVALRSHLGVCVVCGLRLPLGVCALSSTSVCVLASSFHLGGWLALRSSQVRVLLFVPHWCVAPSFPLGCWSRSSPSRCVWSRSFPVSVCVAPLRSPSRCGVALVRPRLGVWCGLRSFHPLGVVWLSFVPHLGVCVALRVTSPRIVQKA